MLALTREIVVKDVMPHLICDNAHSMEHFNSVVYHSVCALTELSLTDTQYNSVILASLLHDLDDEKLTQGHYPEHYWTSYVLTALCKQCPEISKQIDSDLVLLMISLVSCSKNGDSRDESYPWWYYIPRYSDRLEAIGSVGLMRCLAYGERLERPIHSDSTMRVYSRDELSLTASSDKYKKYASGEKGNCSVSSIDCMYIKLIHVTVPEWIESRYLREEFDRRRDFIPDWIVSYWKNLKK